MRARGLLVLGFIAGAAIAQPESGRANARSGFGVSAGGGPESSRESYKTDLFTGAATLSAPIVVSLGSGGFQPELALEYSSQRGNGWVGLGWDLALPSIERMSKFGISAFDPASSDDPLVGDLFALGDDRLVRDDAGVYHTARESYQRIERVDRADGTIDHWIVHRPDGTTLWFGSDSDPFASRLVHPRGLAVRWLLHRARDRNGNVIEYEYDTADGVAYPRLLRYGCDPAHAVCASSMRTVQFVLSAPQGQAGARPDPSLSFRSGIAARLDRRLERIVTTASNGATATTYDLVYWGEAGTPAPENRRSLLHRIDRVAGDRTLYGHFYTYATAAPSWSRDSALEAQLRRLEPFPGDAAREGAYTGFVAGLQARVLGGTLAAFYRWEVADVNGDAAVDLQFSWKQVDLAGVLPTAYNGSAFLNGRAREPQPDFVYLPPRGSFGAGVYRSPRFQATDTAFIDWNGDGRPDWYRCLAAYPATCAADAWIAERGSWRKLAAGEPYASLPPGVAIRQVASCGGQSLEIGISRFADVNGDGLADLLWHHLPSGQWTCAQAVDLANWTAGVFTNDGSGWRSAADPRWSPALASALRALEVRIDQAAQLDLNGDGLIDLARPEGTGVARVRVHTGEGWDDAAALGFALPAGFRPLDLDGDGLVDHVDTGGAQLGTGTGFAASNAAVPALAGDGLDLSQGELATDLNGDGLPDFLRATSTEMEAWLSDGSSERAGLLVRVESPDGGLVDVGYLGTTERPCVPGDRYGCDHSEVVLLAQARCDYPLYRDASDPGGTCRLDLPALPIRVEVVDRVTSDDRNENVRTDRYARALGFYDPLEREFRGFGLVLEDVETPPPYASPLDPGVTIAQGVLRETRFLQYEYLRGAEAWSREVAAEGDRIALESGSDELLGFEVTDYAVTRGDLDVTLFQLDTGVATYCDRSDSVPAAAACVFAALDESNPLPPEAPPPRPPSPLGFASFRAAFGPANRDAGFAYLVAPLQIASAEVDGTSVVVRGTSVLHDAFGNAQYEWRYADGADSVVTTREFAEPQCAALSCGPLHLRALPSCESVFDGSGVEVRRSVRFYDGLSAPGAATRGNLTRHREGLGADETSADLGYALVPNTGVPTSRTDPYYTAAGAAGVTGLDYDASGTLLIGTSRAGLATSLEYDGPGSPPGLGVVHRRYGSNGLEAEIASDAFGRPIAETGPAPIGARRTIEYDDTPRWDPSWHAGRARVRETLRDGVSNESARESFVDGFGRAVAVRATAYADGQAPGQNGALGCVVTRTELDALGRVTRVYAPYAESVPGCRSNAPGQDPPGPPEPPPAGTTFSATLYDARGRVRFSLQRDGGVAEVRYAGLQTTSIDAEGLARTLEHDAAGNLLSVTEHPEPGSAATTRYRYDALGELRGICDPTVSAQSCPVQVSSRPNARHTTQIFYDTLGRRTRIEDPDMGPWDFAYDGAGRLRRRTDAHGVTLHSVYDEAHGRLQCEKPGGTAIAAGQCFDAAHGADVVYAYGDQLGQGTGSLGRLARVTTPEAVVSYAYDVAGRIVRKSVRQPGGGPEYSIAWTHDWLDRERSTAFPDGEVLTALYDARGLDAIVSSAGRSYLADVAHAPDGSVTRIDYGNGTSRDLAYTPSGLLESVQDHGSDPAAPFLARRLSYDRSPRVRAIEDLLAPEEGILAATYDGVGRLRSAVRAGVVLAYAYDALGNLVSKEGTAIPFAHPTKPHAPYDAADPARFVHDANGSLIEHAGRRFAYDARNRLVTATGLEPVAFAYDHGGERIHVEHGAAISDYLTPDYEIQSVRLPDGRVRHGVRFEKTIRAGALLVARVSTGAPGVIVEASMRAPADRGSVGRLALGSTGVAGAALAALLALRWQRRLALLEPALAGSTAILVWLAPFGVAIAQIPDGDVTLDRRLDAADALVEERFSAGSQAPTSTQSLAGDVAPLESAPDGRIDPGDLLLLLRGAVGEDVDGDGLTTDVELSAFSSPFRRDSDRDGTGDAEEIAAGTSPADSDHDGLRDNLEHSWIPGVATDPADPDTDRDGVVDGAESGVARTTPAGDQVHWLHADPLGSVAALTDAAGQVVRRLRFGVFGEPRSNDLGPGAPAGTLDVALGYTGQRVDATTGLHYFGARYYDASLGRFVQPDPIVPDPADPQALNRYAYARNDPLTLVDPTGHLFGFFSFLYAQARAFGSGLWTGFRDAAFNRPFQSAPGFAGRVGSEIGAALAAPVQLARVPFSKHSRHNSKSGAIVGHAAAMSLAAKAGLYVNGMLTGFAKAREEAGRELDGEGLLMHNPSHGFVNDLIEAVVQKFLPGVSGLDRDLRELIADTDRKLLGIPLVVGHSQGSLVVSNALLWSHARGTDAVRRVRLEGSPLSFVMAKAMIGSRLDFNRGTGEWGPTRMFDPVAAIGNPLYIPTALVSTLLTRSLNHSGELYRED